MASALGQIVKILQRHSVEFLIIGGQAEVIFGSPRVTYDTDLCYRRTPENLERLAAALAEIGVTLRGAPAGLPFTADARALAQGTNFTFSTPLGDLDVLGWVEPLGEYEALLAHAETYEFAGHQIRTIGLEDLIHIKKHIGRPKDRESLLQLEAIRQIRESGQG